MSLEQYPTLSGERFDFFPSNPQKENSMKRFNNILVAVDTCLEYHPALEWAVRLAEHTHAKLKIVDVVRDFSWIARLAMSDCDRTQQVLADDKRRNMEAIAGPLRDQGFDVTTKVLFGKTSFEIMHEVLRSGHDLVMRVTKGAHSQRTGFFGTTSMRLLRKCPCAVWLVRPDVPPRFARVLAAIEATPHDLGHDRMNKMIMELGMSIADYEEGQLHVVHAWELFGAGTIKSRLKPGEFEAIERKAESEVAVALDNVLSPYKLSHRTENVHLLRDEIGPGHAISELAKQQEIDLVVMGTLARTGVVGALMGNTAEQVIDRVECSVLTIKPDGFNSPVTLEE
ncbi:MAG: universal stress protein E [Pirellulaceae bacterium]|jgi:universal stress protein E